VSEGKVVVKAKTGGDCVQTPSDLDATYDAHKGPGYQVQIAETCSPENIELSGTRGGTLFGGPAFAKLLSSGQTQ